MVSHAEGRDRGRHLEREQTRMQPDCSDAGEEGTAEAGRDFDPTAPEGESRRDDEAPPTRHRPGVTHGSPLPAAERDRLKEDARRGGVADRGGPAQRDCGD